MRLDRQFIVRLENRVASRLGLANGHFRPVVVVNIKLGQLVSGGVGAGVGGVEPTTREKGGWGSSR